MDMPRGIPKNGFRVRNKNVDTSVAQKATLFSAPRFETDAEIEAKLASRFSILNIMAEGCTNQTIRSLIVSGPAGLGKSYTVEETLKSWDPDESQWTLIKGYIRPTGLFKLIYEIRPPGNVIVFDDADAVFGDETSLNMLKAVCDSSDRRRVSYMSEFRLISDESAEMLPKQFDFEGTIIFITNYDFDAMVEKGHKLSPHFQALVSRSHYVDLAMKTKRDYLIRIKQVARDGLLTQAGLNQTEGAEVLSFIEDNYERMRELSLRMAQKVASVRKLGANWEEIARVTCLRNQ
jgi:hypothetical protein